MAKVSIGHLKNGHAFCDNPKDLIVEAKKLGLSRSEIAVIAGTDVSTIRNWDQKNRAALRPARQLETYLNGPGAVSAFKAHTPAEGTADLVRWLEDWKKLGFRCPYAIQSGIPVSSHAGIKTTAAV
jgi:hypothetical protein